MFQDFQPIAAIATTPIGAKRLQLLTHIPSVQLWLPPSIDGIENAHFYPASLSEQVQQLWKTHRSLVFCLATGAVVRLIAPLLQDKSTDPAVVVIDEAGTFVISLCSGHQGRADHLTRLIAAELGATPVLTGASNRAALPGIDILGVPFGWGKGEGDWTAVSAAISREQTVSVLQDAGSSLWRQTLPNDHPLVFNASKGAAQVRISSMNVVPSDDPSAACVHWHPRVLWVGIGCERGTSQAVIEQAIRTVFATHQLAESAIAGIATIDVKADEQGLLQVCQSRNLPLRCFAAADLQTVEVPNPSRVVEAEVGTPSVAEAAAIWAGYQINQMLDGETATLPPLKVSKQVFRVEGEPGAVTIAVAQAQYEYTGRTGALWLVGTGPGHLDQVTPAAKTAIAQADVVIGYSLYVDLIRPLLRPGQIIETLPITQERQRAIRAIALANWGLAVAVVSSGDCGIYGMAGLVMEQLQAQQWDGQTPTVQVFPGITALQAAASRVGTPLMHDFCAISLSDLLTPWPVIEKRLIAAAQADFVVALYNPKSQTRVEQITIAQQIFLQHRPASTPVAIVRAAYRPNEQITITTLGEFLAYPIDMLSTVLIGNQSTRTYAHWMITPRGYLGFDHQPVNE